MCLGVTSVMAGILGVVLTEDVLLVVVAVGKRVAPVVVETSRVVTVSRLVGLLAVVEIVVCGGN